MSFKEKLLIECVRLIKIGIPITIAQLLNVSMGFVDTVMTGNYSAEALAAASGGHHIMMPLILFGAAVLGAGQAITAQFVGSGSEKAKIGTVTLHGIIIGVVYSILIMLFSRIAPLLFPFFGFEEAVIAQVSDYLYAFSWGLPATLVFIAFAGFYAGISKPVMTMVVSFVMLGVNIIGNYTLIFGNFGFPEMGAEGAGWTSAIAAWSGTLAIILISICHKEVRKYNPLRSAFKLSRFLFLQIFKIGVPSGFSSVFEVSMFAIFTLLMGRFGIHVFAGSQIALNCTSIAFMIPLGLSFAITTNVGLYLGQGKYREARLAGLAGYSVGIFCNLISAMVFFLFAKEIAALYTTDQTVADIAAALLVFAAIFQLSDAIQVSGMGILRGYKDTKIPMISNLISYWGVGMSLGYILGFKFGYEAKGMWIGIIVGLSVAAVLHAIRFKIVSDRQMLQSHKAGL